MLEIHADDYGLFVPQSKRIIQCIKAGNINGISIMPNSPFLDECMRMLFEQSEGEDVLLTVHLNLVEGKALSDRQKIAGLVDKENSFRPSFFKLLLVSFIPGMRKQYRDQIRVELGEQIERCLTFFPDGNLRLDGHRHFHMLPVVFDAITELMIEKKYPVSYIRMPEENWRMYVRLKNKMESFRWVNLLKVIILNILVRRNRRKLKQEGFSDLADASSYFSGVMFSGRMTVKNTKAVLSYIKRKKMDETCHVEILLHPGGVFESDDLEQITDPKDKEFLSSKWRNREKKAAMSVTIQ